MKHTNLQLQYEPLRCQPRLKTLDLAGDPSQGTLRVLAALPHLGAGVVRDEPVRPRDDEEVLAGEGALRGRAAARRAVGLELGRLLVQLLVVQEAPGTRHGRRGLVSLGRPGERLADVLQAKGRPLLVHHDLHVDPGPVPGLHLRELASHGPGVPDVDAELGRLAPRLPELPPARRRRGGGGALDLAAIPHCPEEAHARVLVPVERDLRGLHAGYDARPAGEEDDALAGAEAVDQVEADVRPAEPDVLADAEAAEVV